VVARGNAVNGNTSTRRRLLAGSAIALAIGCGALNAAEAAQPTAGSDPPPAQAGAPGQDDSAGLAPIIVYARKRAENVQNVPQSVQAVTGEVVRLKGIVSAQDLSTITPNLSSQSAFGDTVPNYTLRGISVANEYNSNQASPIGVYVDEAYMTNRISHGVQLFDIDHVEVLSGPQGTLYGRNTTGGAISIYTKKPSLNPGVSGYAEAGVGNYGRRDFQGAIEDTLDSAETFGVRLAINYAQDDGLIRNIYPGAARLNSTDTLAGRLTLRYHPTSNFDATLSAYAGSNKPTSSAVQSIGVTPEGVTAPGGVNPQTGYSRAGLGFFEADMGGAGNYETNGEGVLFHAKWDVSANVQLNSITSYDTGGQDLGIDVDGSPVNWLHDKWVARFSQFNQELRANVKVNDAVNVIVGAYYGQDSVHIDYETLIFNAAPFGFDEFANSIQNRTSAAVFGDMDWKLTDRLTLSIGLRGTRDSIQLVHDTGSITTSPVPTIGPDYSTPMERSAALTGRVALDYKVFDDVSVYASYSRGYRGGAFNQVTPFLSNLTYAKPETVDAYEVGVKSQFWDRRITLNGALFLDKYTNQQLENNIGTLNFLNNAGRSTLEGAEAELTVVPVHGLTFSGTLGYLDAKYDQLTLNSSITGLPVVLNGNDLPFAPHFNSNLSVDWVFATLGEVKLSTDMTASYASHQFFSSFNNSNGAGNLHQDAYWTVNGNLLRVEYKNIYGSLWVRNLLDDQHYVYGIDISGLGFDYLVPAPPRTFGARIGVKF
jgi:iron complex outermembrane receptor protein